MNARKKRYVKKVIIIPMIIAVITTILFFASYSVLAENMLFKNREFTLADYNDVQVIEMDDFTENGAVISKRELPYPSDNTVIGSADLNGQAMQVIFRADELNSNARLNLAEIGSMIGEKGCAFLSLNKKDSAALKVLKENDIIKIDTYYGSYEYKISYINTVDNETALKKSGSAIGRAVAIYTDGSEGVGISDTYYVAVGEMVSGPVVNE